MIVVEPTFRKAIVVVPFEPAQPVVEVAWTPRTVTTGNPGIVTAASPRLAVAADWAGDCVVVTEAQMPWALTSPDTPGAHGADVADVFVVEMAPVSGVRRVATGTPGTVRVAPTP